MSVVLNRWCLFVRQMRFTRSFCLWSQTDIGKRFDESDSLLFLRDLPARIHNFWSAVVPLFTS